jgi:lysine-N-methylase
MEYTYPDYYKKFKCIGGECEDNCCAAGWQITIDDESLEKYETMEGEIGVRLRNSIDWENGMFEQFEHKCALLNENGLCDVYCDAGEDKMCILCQRYPRHYEEFENVREISLSVSCPEAAKIVLGNRGKVGFYTETDEEEEEYEDFDYLMYTKLLDIREILLDVLHERKGSVAHRISKLLDIVHGIQGLIDNDEIFGIDEQEQRALTEQINYRRYTGKMKLRQEYMAEMMQNLHRLEVLRPTWTDFIREVQSILYVYLDAEEYGKLCEEFDSFYGERMQEYEQLMSYFIYTYFCGAVYDYEVESKLRFGIAAVLIIHEMDMAMWYKNKDLTFEEQVGLVHNYSMEIEHSDLNLDDMERMVMNNKAFGYRRLLTVLMNWKENSDEEK